MPCCAPAILSLRAECSENRLCDVARLRLRAVFLRFRSRVGLAALATGLSRTASWSLTFAILHFVWAAGWYVGLSEEKAREAFQKPWFLAYDLIVAVLCAFAVVVALALVQPWGRRMPRRVMALLAWTGAGLLLLRGGAGALQFVFLAVTGKDVWHPSRLWELWFCIGAVLFTLSAWRYTRLPRHDEQKRVFA